MSNLQRQKSSHRTKKLSPCFHILSLRRAVVVVGALAAAFVPANAFAQRALGVDVSHYQGSTINWTSVKNAGKTFAWTKATEGNYYIDPTFTGNTSDAKTAGIIMGAYHFARPDLTSPGNEENYFWAEADSYTLADNKTLMPMLDMETWNGVVGASSYSAWANAWCTAVVSDASAQGVSITPFIYVSACSACNFNSTVSPWFADIANYNGQSAQSGTPWSTCTTCEAWGSGAWDVWQYSSSGSVSGISGGVDVDVYNGTASSLTSKLVAHSAANSWHDWNSLGGILTSAPSACSYGANLIDVWVRGTDNQLWQRSWSGSGWTAYWISHTALPNGLTVVGAPAAAANNQVSGREDLYAIGSDGNLWHDWWAAGSGWRGWQNLGHPDGVTLVGSPAATSWAAGRYDVVAVGTDGATYHTYYAGAGWVPWQSLGGLTQYDPTACSWDANRLDIYVNGSGLIYHKYWQGSTWIDWYQDLPEIRTSYALGASSWGTGRIDLFANYGGSIRHAWYNGTRWAPDWNEAHPGVTATSAACSTSWGYNRIDVFVRGSDNACHHMYWGQ